MMLARLQQLAPILLAFGVLALASRQIGEFLTRFRLPLISGFLLAGVFVGPYGLNLIPAAALPDLRFVDEISLAFIAFAAGTELNLAELRHRLRAISLNISSQVIFMLALATVGLLLMAEQIPFMSELAGNGRLAIALLAAGILVARSPSSAIAIVNELRAKGPFTQMVLGVTVLTDVVVIMLFAINSEIADAIFTGLPFSFTFVALLLGELLLSLLVGLLLGRVLEGITATHAPEKARAGLILLAGYGVFWLSALLRDYSHANLPFEILLEPLLICMVGGFYVTNYTPYRTDFIKVISDLGPPIYVLFFTLTGAALAIDLLLQTWLITLALFTLRLAGIFLGAFSGGLAAGDPAAHNRLSWLTYVTQAGVGLGLAKEVAVEFPEWGGAFATILISVIVLNQIIGPPLFKIAIHKAGEAHPPAQELEFDGVRDALIFGITPESVQLARQLQRHDWQVKLVCTDEDQVPKETPQDLRLISLESWDRQGMAKLGAVYADALVTFLPDEKSLVICEIAYEHFGIKKMVVYLQERAHYDWFRELGALVVEPRSAVVQLLEQFVRAPGGASILLGMHGGQQVADVELRNPELVGQTVRDLRLPLDVLILSAQRNRQILIPHGYTRLELGDVLTMVGSASTLEKVIHHFDA